MPVMPPSSVERIHDDPLPALNPTDLHTHGLIVPASPNTTVPTALPVYGDFVLTALFNYNGGDPATDPAEYDPGAYNRLHAHYDVVYKPLSAADYDIHIPSYQPSGAYSIHPHMHGISPFAVPGPGSQPVLFPGATSCKAEIARASRGPGLASLHVLRRCRYANRCLGGSPPHAQRAS